MLEPIVVATKFRDVNGDGVIEFGAVNRAKYGVASVTYKPELSAPGAFVYWPEGYEPATKIAPRIFALEPAAPEVSVKPSVKTTSQFLNSGEFSRSNWTASNLSAVYKQQTDKTVTKLVLTDWTLRNCGVLFRNYGGPLQNVLIERIQHLGAKYSGGVGAGIFHTSNDECSNVVIRDCVYRGVKPITSPGDIYAVLTFAGKDANDHGKNFLLENLDFEGMWADYSGTQYAGQYLNRDGIAIERGYTDGEVRNAVIRNGSDAGIDCKAPRWRYDNVTVENFREGFKFWNDFEHGALRSVAQRWGHIQVASGPTAPRKIGIDWLEIDSDNPRTPLVVVEGPHTVTVRDGDFSRMPKGQVMIRGVKGGKLIMPDGRVYVS